MRNALATAALSSLLALPALAEVLPPQGAGKVLPIRDEAFANCPDGSCRALFSKVPRGKTLRVDNISCQAQGNQGFTFGETSDVGRILAFLPGSDASGITNVQGPYFFQERETPAVSASSTGQIMQCTLSGFLIPNG
jgi:hypothetical protein